MNLTPSMLTRRLLFAVIAVFGAFVLWLVPSFVVMAPDSNYAARMLREAELVAAAMARGGLDSKKANLIGGNPNNPRIIAAQQRSPFNLNRAEGILRQMQAITNKRIVLYDHQRRIAMDSYNFTNTQNIIMRNLPPLEVEPQTDFQTQKNSEPAYIAPPRGNDPFVLKALAGQSLIRRAPPRKSFLNQNRQDEFRQENAILQAAAPIRRLKFIQGVILLIDRDGAERRAWRWRALIVDSAPFFAAFILALTLLWLWLKGALIRPLAQLAYGAAMKNIPSDHPSAQNTGRLHKRKHNDELDMIARRHQAGQIAAQNFAEASRTLSSFHPPPDSSNYRDQIHIADSKTASQIHVALIGTKIEPVDMALIIQQCIHRHNMRERKFVWRKMRMPPRSSPNQPNALPFGDPILLEKVETSQIRNAFKLSAFSHALTLALDYIIQATAICVVGMWPNAVRVSLIRDKHAINIIIEDDGPDIASYDIKSWIARAYESKQPPLYTLRAIQTCLAMHHGRIAVDQLRPARIRIFLPLFNQTSPL